MTHKVIHYGLHSADPRHGFLYFYQQAQAKGFNGPTLGPRSPKERKAKPRPAYGRLGYGRLFPRRTFWDTAI